MSSRHEACGLAWGGENGSAMPGLRKSQPPGQIRSEAFVQPNWNRPRGGMSYVTGRAYNGGKTIRV